MNSAYRYCLSLTKEEQSAYELLQTSLEKNLRQPSGQIVHAKAYLFRIIRNQYIDEQRRKKRWQFEEFNEESTPNIVLMDLEGLNEHWVAQEEMEYILSFLPDPERELMYLWAVEEFTVQEIADHMHVPKGTLLSKLHRIKKKLGQSLEDRRKRSEV